MSIHVYSCLPFQNQSCADTEYVISDFITTSRDAEGPSLGKYLTGGIQLGCLAGWCIQLTAEESGRIWKKCELTTHK